MGFGEHLEDFRRRLIFSLLGSGFGIALCLYYIGNIISFLVRPYIVALRSLGLSATFGVSGPAEVLMMYLSVGIKAGLVVSSPWIIYQLWLFVGAGLYARERRIVYRYIFPSVVLFVTGICFFFFLILPLSLHFFIAYSQNTLIGTARPNAIEKKIFNMPAADAEIDKLPDGDHVTFPYIPRVKSDPTTFPADRVPLWYNAPDAELKARIGNQTVTFIQHQENSLFTHLPKLGEYLEFVLWACLLFGVSFELPMIMLVLAQIGIVDAAGYRKVRKFAYFGIAVFSAIAAPTTDVLTMMCLALPLVALYEVGIVLGTMVARKRQKNDAAADEPAAKD
jgi:sec-independent protein translocase protein TatC